MKSFPSLCALVLASVLILLASSVAPAQPYTFRFVNHTTYGLSDIFVFAEDTASGLSYDITYNNATTALALQTSKTLQDLLYQGNSDLTVQYSKSLALYVGLGAGAITPQDITDHGLPSYTGGPTVPWAQQNFGIVEASVTGVNDNADVSAINSVGVPMHLKNANGDQSVGFVDPSKLPALRANLNSQMPVTAWPGTANPVRYLGPNQAAVGTLSIPGSTSGLTLPAFTNYFTYVKGQSTPASIKSNISIKQDATHNWQFDYDFAMTVNASNELALTGSVTVKNTLDSGFTPQTVSSLTATVDADDAGAGTYDASNFVYASQASLNSPSIAIGGDWNMLATITGLDFNTEISPNVVDRVLGDMSFGFAYGFIGSTVNNPLTGNLFGEDPSGAWYATGQNMVFDQVQPTDPYYSEYSSLILGASSHVYSHPYSDRLPSGAGDFFGNSINLSGADVLEIHLYDFMAVAVPEPGAGVLCGLAAGVLGGLEFRRRRRARG